MQCSVRRLSAFYHAKLLDLTATMLSWWRKASCRHRVIWDSQVDYATRCLNTFRPLFEFKVTSVTCNCARYYMSRRSGLKSHWFKTWDFPPRQVSFVVRTILDDFPTTFHTRPIPLPDGSDCLIVPSLRILGPRKFYDGCFPSNTITLHTINAESF